MRHAKVFALFKPAVLTFVPASYVNFAVHRAF